MTAGQAGDWAGRELGVRRVAWTERDVVLFALAVGARADELDLVFERDLRVLPTFGLTLAQWAPDLLGTAGAFEVGRAVHGWQTLDVRRPLPTDGELQLAARVAQVWDKGAAAVFEVEVTSPAFIATWGIFAPGAGGFGGERGPGRAADPAGEPMARTSVQTAENQAVLYRLLGDRHHIHVDPDAAAGIGQPRPILHGLATLATSALAAARAVEAHPADLRRLGGRFASVVFPGDELELEIWEDGRFTSTGPQGIAINDGEVRFS